jgi:chromodomain-helicase-DNA-binding protein 4
MASLVGYLFQKWQATPSLIVVPKSTVINWVREFERWAPDLTVVPFFGDRDSKEIILDYEAFHSPAPKKFSKIKFHVLITTYESVTNGSLSPILAAVDRWELLVVDEGQKCKYLCHRGIRLTRSSLQ